MTIQTIQYFLPKHVFLCVVDASVVFLDLHNDKYISLEPEKTETLISLLSINSVRLPASVNSACERHTGKLKNECFGDSNSVRKLVKDLTGHHLLTADQANGAEKPLLSINIPQLDLSGYYFDKTPNIKTSHMLKFFMASIYAFFKVRLLSTEQVVKSVKKRKKRGSKKHVNPDLDEIRQLVEIFKILRPLFFTAKNHCLFDSLALIEFMARYNIYPIWVFGVKMRPFEAHCWVQDDNFIYNESLDQAHYFTPIMAV